MGTLATLHSSPLLLCRPTLNNAAASALPDTSANTACNFPVRFASPLSLSPLPAASPSDSSLAVGIPGLTYPTNLQLTTGEVVVLYRATVPADACGGLSTTASRLPVGSHAMLLMHEVDDVDLSVGPGKSSVLQKEQQGTVGSVDRLMAQLILME